MSVLKFNSKKLFIAKVCVVLVMTALLFPGAAVVAHDGWTQTHTPIIEPGEVSYVELLFGNHSNNHASYRITGTWNPDDTDVIVTTPDGERVNIANTLFYTGELDGAAGDQLGVNNYYVASFAAFDPGVYIISAERDSIFAQGETASRTMRSAKSFVAVSDLPLVSVVRNLDGYDRHVSPDRAEIVPLFNPTAVTAGQEVSIQVVLQGEPIADEEVSLIRRSNSDAQTFVTDENGTITFTTGEADFYLVRTKPTFEEGSDNNEAYQSLSYEATMTFSVQNGTGLAQEELAEGVHSWGEEHGLDLGVGDTATGGNDKASLFSNVFFYISIGLAAGMVVTLIFNMRKK